MMTPHEALKTLNKLVRPVWWFNATEMERPRAYANLQARKDRAAKAVENMSRAMDNASSDEYYWAAWKRWTYWTMVDALYEVCIAKNGELQDTPPPKFTGGMDPSADAVIDWIKAL